MSRRFVCSLAAAFLACLYAGSVSGTIILVPAHQPTIQAGINATLEGDTVLVSPGTWVENIDFGGKAIAVIGAEGATATTLTPADPSASTILMINGEGAGTEFAGFTVSGGAGPSVIQIEAGATPLIRNNVFRGYYSVMSNAIGIESHYSNPTITRNLFIDNTGTIGCVGIMSGDGLITNNTFDSNMRGFWSQSPTVVARNNIVTNSDEFGIADEFDADYNCIYNNNPNYAVGAVPGPNDISSDPIYCDPDFEDYGLDLLSPCVATGTGGLDRGAFGVGCGFGGPIVRYIAVGDGDLQHVVDDTPVISWWYDDPEDTPLASSEIEVGMDSDWTIAEMWQSPPIPGPDTATVYAGSPLVDGSTYFVRVRASNGTEWSDWRVQSFRMNSQPTVPILLSPIAGASVHTSCTNLLVENSIDDEADPLTYDFRVYDDPGLTGLVFEQSGVPEQADETGSDLLSSLQGGVTYYWHARAQDGFEASDWSAPDFFEALTSTSLRVPQEYTTIQSAIYAAECGDTVLVAAGTYYTNLDFLGKAIKVIGESGAEFTILRPLAPSNTIILMVNGEPLGTEFAGFTVAGGIGPSVIQVENGGQPLIRNNVFRDYSSSMDNAIVIETHFSDPTITHNLFLDNRGIACVGIMDGTAQILYNTFDGNDRGFFTISGQGVARNNIVTNSVEYGIYGPFTMDYNCLWNNDPDYAGGATLGLNDITADPMYCDTALEDYSLDYISPCTGTGEDGTDRGAFGVGCNAPGSGPTVRALLVGDNLERVAGETPLISWLYSDPDGIPIAESDVEVGTDNDWTVAEMWQAYAIPGPDTSVVYAGLPLADGGDYYVRVRVSNGAIWSSWKVAGFHMNAAPTVPVLVSPIAGVGVVAQCTQLVLDNSTDGESDPVSYDFEVYDDAGLTSLVYSESEVPEQVSQTSSDYLLSLSGGLTYWWRARSRDDLEASAWSATEWFEAVAPGVRHVPAEYGTIQAAIDAAQCGDTVLVAAGTYTENIDLLGKPIKVIGADGAAATTLTPDEPSQSTILMISGEGVGTEFSGFTVRGGAGPSVIQVEGGAQPIIRDNVFRDYYSIMQNAIVLECHASNPIIAHNLFVDNTGTIGCVGVMSGDGIILNNTFDGNMRGFWSQSPTVIARNNIVTNSIEFGIAVEFDADYNCVYLNNPDYALGAVPGPNDISADPLYCDPLSQDYNLEYFSPCAGTGEGAVDRGAFGVGCGLGPGVVGIAVGDGDQDHITDHYPVIAWLYGDSDGKPLVSSDVEVGTDTDWSVAEMWQSGIIPAPDTSVVYGGLPLEDGDTYFVRIRVANDSVWSGWRTVSFRMNSMPVSPTPELPLDGSAVTTATPVLRVGGLSDSEGDALLCTFEVYYGAELVAAGTDIPAPGSQLSWTVVPPLTHENESYWWRARAFDGLEYGDWSSDRTFALNAVNDPPGPVVLLSPDSNVVLFDLTPYFDWLDADDPDPEAAERVTYTFTIATDSLFLFKIEYRNLPFSYYQSSMLPFGLHYWWRVKATDLGGASSESAVRSLYIPAPGDLNGDGVRDVLDVVLLIDIAFRGALVPENIYVVDVNGDCIINVLDAVTLIQHVFRGAPAPNALCGEEIDDRVRHVPLEYQSIQLAINAAAAGDTVLVAAGSYWENIDLLGKTIHVIGEEGAAATILQPADPNVTVINMTSGEGYGTEFTGFTVYGGAGPSVIQIENGAAPIIHHNLFRDYHSLLQNAIVVESHLSDPTIAYNLFLKNTGTIGCVGIFSGGGHIVNNTFDQNMRGFWSQSPDVVARNNIVTNSTEFGVADVFDSDYNCVFNNNPDYAVGAVPGAHDISANPAYCDPAAEDYGLQPGSPCEGTGESGADMGAFDVGCTPP